MARSSSAGSAQSAQVTQQDTVTVHAFNPAKGDFEAAAATRVEPDVYELQSGPIGDGLDVGDLVRCELSDGELVVRERVFTTRLL